MYIIYTYFKVIKANFLKINNQSNFEKIKEREKEYKKSQRTFVFIHVQKSF